MKTYFVYAGLLLCLFSLSVLIRRDWYRLTSRSRRVLAQTIDHRQMRDADGILVWAAIYRFKTEQGLHDVVDQLYESAPKPTVGTTVELAFPEGRPHLARPPRTLLWFAVYAFLVSSIGLLGFF